MGRRELSAAEKYHLWAMSGGLCSFKGCNKRLIRNDNGKLNNVGEIAHIIGYAKSSARHEFTEKYGFQDDTENIKNLTLMCKEHHTVIDGHYSRADYPPELLFQWKDEHEKKIASWIGEKKKSIALIHKRFGPPINKLLHSGEPPYLLLEAVEEQEEFVDFTRHGWLDAKQRNINLQQKFQDRVQENDAEVLEVFPMSPIPLLIHLGFLLSDTVPISVYQWDREEENWVQDPPQPKKSSYPAVSQEEDIQENDELAVMVSVSGKVQIRDVEKTLNQPVDILSFHIKDPNVKSILYRDDVKFIQAIVKDKIEQLLGKYDYQKLHLFCAVPAGLAIEIGRGINTNIWGEVCLYEYKRVNNPRYHYAISLP